MATARWRLEGYRWGRAEYSTIKPYRLSLIELKRRQQQQVDPKQSALRPPVSASNRVARGATSQRPRNLVLF